MDATLSDQTDESTRETNNQTGKKKSRMSSFNRIQFTQSINNCPRVKIQRQEKTQIAQRIEKEEEEEEIFCIEGFLFPRVSLLSSR